MSILMPYLDEAQRQSAQEGRRLALSKALQATRQMRNTGKRLAELAALAPRLVDLPADNLAPLWQETLPELAGRTRLDLLSDFSALPQAIQTLGGEAALAEVFEAIEAVGRWWP